MTALILAPFYLLLCTYLLRWFYKWLGVCHFWFHSIRFQIAFSCLYVFTCLTPLTSFLIRKGRAHHWLKALNNYWFGVLLYALIIIGGADFIRFICHRIPSIRDSIYKQKRTFIITGFLAGILIIAVSTYGFLHVKHIQEKDYRLTFNKNCEKHKSLRIALVADLHLGYSIGNWQMKQMVQKINDMEADLVLIAGDIYDNEYEAIKNPDKIANTLSHIKSRYGVYACWGNHDVNEKILAGFTFRFGNASEKDDPRMTDFLNKAGVTLLEDEVILINDSFYLAGRKDPSRSKKLEENRKSPAELLDCLDQTKPVFVIDHQPKDFQELQEAGADLVMGGHTHDGQMFPGNLITRLFWENSYGYAKIKNMHSVVTSGVGVWGPAMRVGTDSEVVCIDINLGQ